MKNIIYVYWGIKKGHPLWDEEFLLESERKLDATEFEQLLIENGCDFGRESILDLTEKPDFKKAINI